ncbi:MAG: hypothetical protein GY866_42185 [Proteobacteria bacterium]|nr:hypothetical protein [Pseudomonadota bacterium]
MTGGCFDGQPIHQRRNADLFASFEDRRQLVLQFAKVFRTFVQFCAKGNSKFFFLEPTGENVDAAEMMALDIGRFA